MADLSPTARRVLMAARAAAEPTAADRARVQGLLVASIASIATPAATAAAASAVGSKVGSAAAGTSLFAQMNIAVFAAALALGGGYAAFSWSASPAPASTTVAPSAAPTPIASTPTRSEPIAALATAPSVSTQQAQPRPLRVRRSSSASSTHVAHVAKEIAWLTRAEAALERGAPDVALRALQQHADRFPRGELVQERLGLRAVALCSLTRRPAARTAANDFVTRYPQSMLAPRVRAACADAIVRGAE